MRRLSAAIVVSVTSHVVALGWLVWSGSVQAVPLRDRPAPAVPPIAASTPETPAMEIAVVLLDPREPPREQPRPVDAPTSPARSRTARRRAEEPAGETIVLGGT
ncbi:MAG TPA: hypothetical protein VIX73_27655, partial [Kofleriaceae bacterium]